MKRKHIFITAISVVLLLIVGVITYAWYVEYFKDNDLIMVTSDVNLKETDITLYYGTDSNYDGELDDDLPDPYAGNEITKSGGFAFTDLILPTYRLSYKLVVKNNNKYGLYFNASVGQVTGDMLIQLFAFESITYEIYNNATVKSTGTCTNTYIQYLVDQTEKSFINGVYLEPNETAEIKFQLVFLTIEEINNYGNPVKSTFMDDVEEQINSTNNYQFKIGQLVLSLTTKDEHF